jgi:hypothetical protein
MKCKYCGRLDAEVTCICGYCTECINKYGHDNIFKELNKTKEKKQ